MNDMNTYSDWDDEAEKRDHFDRYVLPDLGIDPEDGYTVGLAYDSWSDRMDAERDATLDDADYEAEQMAIAALDDAACGYTCPQCGKPVSAAEADDNGGKCEECAQNELDVPEFQIYYDAQGREHAEF